MSVGNLTSYHLGGAIWGQQGDTGPPSKMLCNPLLATLIFESILVLFLGINNSMSAKRTVVLILIITIINCLRCIFDHLIFNGFLHLCLPSKDFCSLPSLMQIVLAPPLLTICFGLNDEAYVLKQGPGLRSAKQKDMQHLKLKSTLPLVVTFD